MVKKILIYNSGGGLGDAIQLFPLILSIKNQFNPTDFYYLGAHENHFVGKLKNYNVKINLNSSCLITLFSHKFAKITYN